MKAVGIIFSNIHDKEIPELTSNRTLASVPFGGRFRLIDFTLSNLVNSGVTKVGIITKKNYQSLLDHIGSGKNWDLSRKNGGLIVLPPYGEGGSILYRSRFEAIKNTERFVKRCDEDYVIMSDCDNVCNIDFAEVLKAHIEKNADMTLLYRKKNIVKGEGKMRTAFTVGDGNRITKVDNSEKLSGTHNIFTNIFIVSRKFLLNIIENGDQLGYTSFSKDVITRVNEFRIFGYELNGYFSSIDNLKNYYKHSMELLDSSNRKNLFKTDMDIYTKVRDSAPCRMEECAKVSNSLIADGCVIEGEVKNSILFRGVKVEKGAVVENSVLFQDTIVGQNTKLNCVIADKQAIILEKRILSGHETQPYFISKSSVI